MYTRTQCTSRLLS